MNQSVERALRVLEELAGGRRRLGELAEVLGTHKSTVLRLLQTLESHGFVERVDSGTYRLGVRLVQLGSVVLQDLDLPDTAREGLVQLADTTGETVHLAIADGARVVYLDKVESIHPVRMYSRVGATAPIHCTGVGKVLLAYTEPDRWPVLDLRRYTEQTITDRGALEDAAAAIRERGWGVDEREHEDSIRCIAAPILDVAGDVVAAISVSVPTSRMSRAELDRFVPDLLAATDLVTRKLGGRPTARVAT